MTSWLKLGEIITKQYFRSNIRILFFLNSVHSHREKRIHARIQYRNRIVASSLSSVIVCSRRIRSQERFIVFTRRLAKTTCFNRLSYFLPALFTLSLIMSEKQEGMMDRMLISGEYIFFRHGDPIIYRLHDLVSSIFSHGLSSATALRRSKWFTDGTQYGSRFEHFLFIFFLNLFIYL